MLIMRKLVFAALAGVFMLSSGFANNSANQKNVDSEIKENLDLEDFGNCDFAITYTTRGEDGEWTQETVFYSTWAMSNNSCINQAASTAGMFGTVAYRHYRSTSIFE
jgi:hypothetical protein